MNKKKVLSLVLSFTLVFTTVFAGAGSVFAGETAADTAKSSLRGKMLYSEIEEPQIDSKTIYYSTSSAPKYSNYTVEAGGYVRIVPIKASSTGWMYLDVTSSAENDGSVGVYLVDNYEYDSATGNVSIPEGTNGESTYGSAGETKKNACKIAVTKGKTYYVWLQSSSYSEVNAVVGIRAKVYTTGTRTLSAGTSKWTVASGISKSGEYGASTWFKVKPTKTGVMIVSLKEYGYSSSYGKVTLYNASKKVRSEKVTYSSSGSKVKFGVKKGTTYYLKVSDCYGSYDNNYKFGIRYSITAAKDRAISKKSSAKRIYRKDDATKTLFTAANANSVDYYKFTVKTARKTKVTVKTTDITSGYVVMRLYKSNGKLLKKLEIPAQSEGYIYTTSKLSKGTYYVKITKSAKASGRYSVRWTY